MDVLLIGKDTGVGSGGAVRGGSLFWRGLTRTGSSLACGVDVGCESLHCVSVAVVWPKWMGICFAFDRVPICCLTLRQEVWTLCKRLFGWSAAATMLIICDAWSVLRLFW